MGGKAREALIVSNWPDLFRCTATMSAGQVAPSRILCKLASYPRQNDLVAALREVGRIERTLFIIKWILDADMQRRTQVGLNKGEAHHALKNALRIGRQGEICDRTTEGQHYRIAGLNPLTAIIVYRNTLHLGHAVEARRSEGLDTPDHLLAHILPLGWAHILLTGEYLWPKDVSAWGVIPPPAGTDPSLATARRIIEAWRADYNTVRPHSSLRVGTRRVYEPPAPTAYLNRS